jgi:hypothetical protein
MPRACTICTHDDREQINAALVAGQPYRTVADRFGAAPGAVLRHRMAHLPVALTKAQEAVEVARADTLLDQVRQLQAKALAILTRAEQTGDLRTALLGIGQARGCLELLAKLEGELDERPQINVLLSPQWLLVRTVVLEALQPYPDARAGVTARLRALELA